MRRHAGTLLAVAVALTLVVGVATAHAQSGESESQSWRLTLQAEVQADLMALAQAPEIDIDVTFEDDLGQLGLGLSRNLAQTDAYEVQLSESLKHRSWRLGTSIRWRYGATPTAGVTIGWRPDWGQAQLSINAPSSGVNWELSGRYRGNAWQLNLHKLTGTLTSATLVHATWDWSPDSTPMSFGGRINRSQSPPLTLETNASLPHDVNVRTTQRFSLDAGLGSWRSTTLGAERDPVQASVDLDVNGWQSVSATWERELVQDWTASTGISIEPAGWRESDLELAWQPDLTNELSGEITLRPDGWTVSPSVNWRTDQPSTSVNGALSLDPDGLGSARVNADASVGPLSLSGFSNYSGSTWMLDLSGSLTQRPWHLSAKGAWLGRLGFDGGTMRLGRDWSWTVPPSF